MEMIRQFTATVYILDGDRVLLIYHRKLQKWLPPGGHIDPNETPPEAARREALEETGLEVELLSQENVWVKESNATSFERPFMCLLEDIPAHGDQPAHQHMDMVYVGRQIGGQIQQNHDETGGVRWFTLSEIEDLELEVTLFTETRDTLRVLLSSSADRPRMQAPVPHVRS